MEHGPAPKRRGGDDSVQPTVPLNPDAQPTEVIVRGCRAGHDQPNNPTWHPTLGMVPALTSVVFAAILVGVILAVELWLLPALIPWTLGLLAIGLLVSAIIQFLLGHRGWCWLWRSLRWWLGPIGTLVDPIEMG
ncbi:MAG: hypothetical protein V9E98_08890 [Candidatus Nanopelagicales bacterium]